MIRLNIVNLEVLYSAVIGCYVLKCVCFLPLNHHFFFKVRFGIRNLRNTDINKQLKIQTDINVLNEMAQISGQTKTLSG